MKYPFFITSLAVCLLPSFVFAGTPKDELPFTHLPLMNVVPTPAPTTAPQLTEKELLADMTLFNEVISQAIDRNDVHGLKILLPVYAQADHRDEILYLYAQAVIQEQQNIKYAIDYYQQILHQKPKLTPIRVRLILAYLANHQIRLAQDEFAIAKQDSTMPYEILASLNQRFKELNQVKKHFSMRYLDDDNINNAPKNSQYQGWQLPEAESAHGLGYTAKLSKSHHLKDHLSLEATASLYGKYYWDNQTYNDIIAEISPSLSYQNFDGQFELGIYQQWRHFGKDPYSSTHGLRLTSYQFIGRDHQGGIEIDIAKKTHRTRKFLDGTSHLVTLSLNRHANPSYYFGINFIKDDVNDLSESYQQGTLFAGLNKSWGNIHTGHQVSVGKRSYQDLDFFGIKRDDWRYQTEHRIWHQNVHYKGYYPSLHLRFERIDSNHFSHDTKSTQVFMSVDRKF